MRESLNKGDLVLVNFNPTKGHEQNGIRPAVVISGNDFHVSGLCFVFPLTSQIKSYFGGIVLEPNDSNGLSETSEVLVSQIRTIDQRRIVKILGVIEDSELKDLHWGLDQLMDR